MFCAPRLIIGGTEGVRSRFHALRSRTHFRRYRERRVPFSCFVPLDSFSAIPRASGAVFQVLRPDSFSTILRASGPVFKFCAHGIVFGGTEGVESRFHIMCARNLFRRYRGRRHPFSCFARPDLFRRYRGRWSPFLCFARPDAFWRYRGRWSPFSSFACPDSFSAVPRVSGPIFMFWALGPISAVPRALGHIFISCPPELIFCGTEGVRYHFHVLRARTHFQRHRVRRVPFSCFARPDSFSAVPRASAPVFKFCAPGIVFGFTKGVGPHHTIR
jgi:hypothetical protein